MLYKGGYGKRMKKLWTLLLSIFLLMNTIPVQAAPVVSATKSTGLALTIDGKAVNYTDAQLKVKCNNKSLNIIKTPGILYLGWAMVPYDSVFANSSLKVKTSYNAKTGKLNMQYQGNSLVLTVGSKTAMLNKKKVTLSVPPMSVTYKKAKKTKILIPAKNVAGYLNIGYSWSAADGTVSISGVKNGTKSGFMISYDGKKVAYTKAKAKITIDGITVKSAMPGLIINNTTMVPANAVFKQSSIQADYSYNSKKKTLTLKANDNKLVMTLGKITATLNGKKVTLPEAPKMITNVSTKKSYLMVPANFVANALGYDYEWSNSTVTSIITSNPDDGGNIGDPDDNPDDEPADEPADDPDDIKDPVTDPDPEPEPEPDPVDPSDNNQKVPTGKNVIFTLPSRISAASVTTNDDYINRRFVLTIPGDQTAFYQTHAPIMQNTADKVIKKVTAQLNDNGDTDIIIQTTAIRAFVVSSTAGKMNIAVKKAKEVYKQVVVVDAGHGGSDPGAINSSLGLHEKDLTLGIVQNIKEIADEDPNLKVYYTRLHDYENTITKGSAGIASTSMSLVGRYNFTNEVQPDFFISVHINSVKDNTSANGTETFYAASNNYKNSGGLTSKKLAEIGHEYLQAAVGRMDRKVKVNSGLAVLRKAQCPAILMEVGFITNDTDAKLMADKDNQYTIANSIYDTMITAFSQYPVD